MRQFDQKDSRGEALLMQRLRAFVAEGAVGKKTDSPVMKHGWEIPELNGGFHGKVIYKWRINRLTCVYRDIYIIYDNNVYIHTYTSTYTYTYIGR